MAGVSDKELLRRGPWPAGTFNLSGEGEPPVSDGRSPQPIGLREAVNVDLAASGWPQRRRGYTKRYSGSNVHSLWRDGFFPFALFVDESTLYALPAGGAPFAVATGLGPFELSYWLVNDRAYWSNGQRTGVVRSDGSASAWGVASPAGQPAVAATAAGGLTAGRYQVAITYRSITGEESGTGRAAILSLSEGQGIALSNVPQPADPDVVAVRVYVSPPDGDVLYFARDLPVGMVAATIGVGSSTVPLATQFLEPMPAGHIVRALNARLFVAAGGHIHWSEALRYGLRQPVGNRLGLGKRVQLMEPVGDGTDGAGLFVADGKRTFWLSGSDPAQFAQRIVYHHGAVPGTGLRVPGQRFGLDTTMPVAYWLATDGVALLGLPGGTVVPLRGDQVVAPTASRGASLYREGAGLFQVITALQGAVPNATAVRDRAIARVYRDGCEV